MVILKFGGSSVANPESIEKVISVLYDKRISGVAYHVVFSAFGKTTDILVRCSEWARNGDGSYEDQLAHLFSHYMIVADYFLMGHKDYDVWSRDISDSFNVLGELLKSIYLSRELTAQFRDLVLSYGECISNLLLSYILVSKGFNVKFLDARKIIKTNSNFGQAQILWWATKPLIQKTFSRSEESYIITGFIASTMDEITTTLGRGGSDYTASVIASVIGADAIEIWTDVDGVLTADPRKIDNAVSLEQLSYLEAMELSHYGARVLFPPTILPAMEAGIPIHIKNTLNPHHPGTVVRDYDENNRPNRDIAGITSIPHLCIITIEGVLGLGIHNLAARLFGCLSKEVIDIYLITQGSSERAISFSVSDVLRKHISALIRKEFSREIEANEIRLLIESDMCAIAIVGEKVLFKPGISGIAFSALGSEDINIEATAQGSSERTISLMVRQANELRALRALHNAFF